MCLEITYSAIVEIFFDALKTGQNEKSYIFQEIGIPKIHVQLFENFQNLWHFKFDPLPVQKNLSGWQMELTLVEIV